MDQINQEYVNANVDNIVEWMKKISPEEAKNSRNWKQSLLKDWQSKKWAVAGYHKHANMTDSEKNLSRRTDKFYNKEFLLEERILNQKEKEHVFRAESEEWRKCVQAMRSKLREELGTSDYQRFVAEHLADIKPYYGVL
mgnify:FL=1